MEQPQYFTNLDLENIITPVNTNKLIAMLQEAEYCEKEVAFLQNGLTNGFSIEYAGPQKCQSSAENIPFSVGDEVELWNKLIKEVKLG